MLCPCPIFYYQLHSFNIAQVTAGDESGIHIWDLRMLKLPILELPGHAHWYHFTLMLQAHLPFIWLHALWSLMNCAYSKNQYSHAWLSLMGPFLTFACRTWAVRCNPEYDGLILVLSLSLSPQTHMCMPTLFLYPLQAEAVILVNHEYNPEIHWIYCL